MLVGLLRVGRIALVRTTLDVRERRPSHGLARAARRLLNRATTTFVVFDASTRTPDAERTRVVAHAHFRDRFIGYPLSEKIPGRVLCLNPSDLSEDVQASFMAIQTATTLGATLRFAGTASEMVESNILTASLRDASRLSWRFEPLSDGAHVQEISSAELVLAPNVDSMERLQGVFLALSLDRPVLTPRTEAMSLLAEEIGPGWVHLSDGAITADAIDDALTLSRDARRPSRPNLDGRDLLSTQAAYSEVFRAASLARRHRARE